MVNTCIVLPLFVIGLGRNNNIIAVIVIRFVYAINRKRDRNYYYSINGDRRFAEKHDGRWNNAETLFSFSNIIFKNIIQK